MSTKDKKTPAKSDVNQTIDKIFFAVTDALKEGRNQKITLDKVDHTLEVLFNAINQAQEKGSNANIPDFKKILKQEEMAGQK